MKSCAVGVGEWAKEDEKIRQRQGRYAVIC